MIFRRMSKHSEPQKTSPVPDAEQKKKLLEKFFQLPPCPDFELDRSGGQQIQERKLFDDFPD